MQKVLLSILVIVGVLLSGCNEDKVTIPKVNSPVQTQTVVSTSDVVDNIQTKILSTKELKYCKVSVSKEGENIILLGQVYTKKQKFLASSVARSVQGSGRVINRLVMP